MSKHASDNGFAVLGDLGEVVQVVQITSPDGRGLRLRLRSLGADEMQQVRRGIAWPQEPREPQRDPTDNKVRLLPVVVGPLRERYEQELADATQEQMHRLLARSLVGLDMPGESDAEHAAALRSQLGFWALKQLTNHMLRLNRITDEEVEEAAEGFPLAT